MDWISDNKEWLFSGTGVAVLTAAVGVWQAKRTRPGSTKVQSQRAGRNSRNTQIGGNVTFTNPPPRADDPDE